MKKQVGPYGPSYSPSLHLKAAITGDKMVVGGRNLSSSGWWDISYIVTSKSDITETKEYILEIVKNLSEEGNYSLPTFKTDKILLGGKYKGRKISEIKKENPGYIQWCHENLDIEGLRRLGLKCN